MAKKLTYFDIKGLAESVRYLLHYGGIEFEDERIAHDAEWPKIKEKISPPFGKLPLYHEGGRTLNQSVAIARYIGRTLNLVPTDPWEEASVDAVVLTLNDFFAGATAISREQDPVKKEAIRKEIVEESIDFYFSRFDKQLKENNGHFGKKLTWADFVFVNTVDITNDYLQVDIPAKYPHIKALMDKIFNLPKIKQYIEKRNKK